jgi:hypothetical protein
MEEEEIQIVQIDDKIIIIPIEFVNIFKLVDSKEFKDYLNSQEVINNMPKFNYLTSKLIFDGQSLKTKTKSIFDYVPDFIAYWTTLKRDEKIDKILNKDR